MQTCEVLPNTGSPAGFLETLPMWKATALSAARAAARRLPAIVAKRFFDVKTIEQQLEIGWTGGECIRIYTNAWLPYVDLALRLCNKSPVPILIDRVLLEFWVNQPLAEFLNPRRTVLSPGETVEYWLSRCPMNEFQVKFLHEQRDASNHLKHYAQLHATLFVDCRLGSFSMRRTLPQVSGDVIKCN